MPAITKTPVADGLVYVSIPAAEVHILCGCPADAVKHLMKRGLIQPLESGGIRYETGPNAILLSDVLIQNGHFSNLAEFPILQMFYRQGMIIPGHPGNTGVKPALIGSRRQVESQMEYVYRGNYGLVSEEEMLLAGATPEQAREMMRLKLKFAFGKIRRMEEYLDLVIVENELQEIRNKVFIRRMKPNVFEISFGKQSVRVDLNPPRHTRYLPPYVLGYHQIRRDYFAVVHTGEGDGWDHNRPAMASILLYQGKVFLIDAGPNIRHSLSALGIGVNEIAGVFHTHAHDDHFCGLAALMRTDHRIPYYATPLVRSSVTKKLAALTMTSEEEFIHYFEPFDLKLGEWNDIDTLEVKPVFSPHPVETTVLFFRTMDRNGYRTYAHMADIASLKLLRGMVTEDADAPGLSCGTFEEVTRSYLEPVDLKKLDIGGGMIHGDAEDFAADKSGKIVLAHTALPLSSRQKEIGSGAPFGTVDVLIPAHQDYLRSYAFYFLSRYFPTVPQSRLRILLNSPISRFNPESLILKSGRKADSVLLILTGQVEVLRTRAGVYSSLTAGGMMGEATALSARPSAETYRAVSFVQTLRIPLDLYAQFVRSNGLLEDMLRLLDVRAFLNANSLLGESISSGTQNAIAESISELEIPAGQNLADQADPCLLLVREGSVDLTLGERLVQSLGPGDCFNESVVLFDTPALFRAHSRKGARLHAIPASVIAGVPIVRWKLLESFERRMDLALSLDDGGKHFTWQDEYDVHVAVIDQQHRDLFLQGKRLYEALFSGHRASGMQEVFAALLDAAVKHFALEEELMRAHDYPDYKNHRRRHESIMRAIQDHSAVHAAYNVTSKKDVGIFIKDGVMMHILTEDRRLGTFLNKRGLR